jgi:nucleotide-binding universal stress UspA family protein
VAILHAYEIPIYGIPDGAFVATPEMVGRIQAAGQAALDATIAKRQGRGVPLEGHLSEGRPWEVIHETAAKVGADLIVIGTHGRRGLARALLGSVAEKVIRTATLPVLTVHSPQPA